MADDTQMSANLELILARAREAAETGRLESAVGQLQGLIVGGNRGTGPLLARALELQGRCELGLLRNVQAMMSFREAELTYESCGLETEGAYCRLMQVRKLLDDKQLRLAQRHLDKAIEDARIFDWQDVHRLGLEFMGLLKLHAREFRRAAELLEEALETPDRRKLGWEPLLVKLSLTNCYFSLENRGRAMELLSHLREDPRFEHIPRLSIYTLMNLGYHSYLMGERGAARGYFDDVLQQVYQRERQPRAFGWLGVMARYNLGQLAIDDGDFKSAVEILQEVVEHTANHGYQQLLAGGLLALSIAELLCDQPSRAMRHALLSQHHVLDLGDIETQLAGYILALVHLAENRLDDARRFWREKPVLENHLETGLHYSWMIKILEHLRDTGAGEPYNLGPEALDLVQAWLVEVEGFRLGPAATAS